MLVDLWRNREGRTGVAQPICTDLLEQLVFAKLYFEHRGLFLAFDGGMPVGFAHAGFGPNENRSWLSTELGVICLVAVHPDCAQANEVAGELLDRCEGYLRDSGAQVLCGGSASPWTPFYFGLYGGSESPGILDSDSLVQQLFKARGYEPVQQTLLLRRDLNGFESLIDRQQMQIRRQMIVEVINDAPTRSWWEASILGEFDLTRFDLVPRTGGPAIASAVFRSMEPSVTNAMGRATGLIHFHVDEGYRGRGVANFLLSEAFRQFIRQGIQQVDAQISQNEEAALAVMRKLGFQLVEEGCVYRKKA
jgi:ribosomal protein S18 acetylase RimI-like enzyme